MYQGSAFQKVGPGCEVRKCEQVCKDIWCCLSPSDVLFYAKPLRVGYCLVMERAVALFSCAVSRLTRRGLGTAANPKGLSGMAGLRD